ncbi:ABC transporter substrate-binding protein [Actinophytocola sediminis]
MRRLLAVVVLAVGVSGCGAPPPAATTGGAAITVQDCQGDDVAFAEPPRRVVAIDGWAAQAMAHLGLTDRLVGIGFTGPLTAEPEPLRGDLAKVPVLSADTVPVTETIAATRPDAVITGFPGFGGPPGSPRDADLATMGANGIAACLPAGPVMSDLTATYEFLTTLGTVFGVSDRADTLIAELRARTEAVADLAGDGPRPRVLALADNPVAGQPVKALGGGTISNAVIELAGGDNIFADVTAMHADVSPEKVAELDPEVIWVVTDFSFARTTGRELVDSIRNNPLLASTTAVERGRILATSQYLVGMPTPLNVDGLERFAAELWPENT